MCEWDFPNKWSLQEQGTWVAQLIAINGFGFDLPCFPTCLHAGILARLVLHHVLIIKVRAGHRGWHNKQLPPSVSDADILSCCFFSHRLFVFHCGGYSKGPMSQSTHLWHWRRWADLLQTVSWNRQIPQSIFHMRWVQKPATWEIFD